MSEADGATRRFALTNILVVDYHKCTGCRACEMACSVSHVRVNNPAKAAIHVVKWMGRGLNVPVVCHQCEDPACANICPVQAISRDGETDALVVDPDLCVGCRLCIVACPFGAITFDQDQRRAIKCDLCGDGEPWCVRVCQPGALTYRPPATISVDRKREAAQKVREAPGPRPGRPILLGEEG